MATTIHPATTVTMRRARPGEVGSHFNGDGDCPGYHCPPASYRRHPRVAGDMMGVRVHCEHGLFVGCIPADTAAAALPYHAPFTTTRETTHD